MSLEREKERQRERERERERERKREREREREREKAQNLEGNLYLTENRFSESEMSCAVVNYNYMRQIIAKGFLDSNFD